MNCAARSLIDERRERLWTETDFTATLFEKLTGFAVVAADFDGNLLAYNEGARQIYGYAPEEVIGKLSVEAFFPDEFIAADGFDRAIRTLLQTGHLAYEGEKVRKGGGRFPAQVLFTLTKDKAGQVVGFVEIVEDLTEKKRIEGELRLAKEAADAANQAKSAFLANMSHEIRTPMNGIIGMTELALRTPLTPAQRECLTTIKYSADTLLRLLNDILDFSKIEAGKLELEAVDFALRDTIGAMAHALGVRAGQKGLELAYRVPPEVPDRLIGDPGRLCQILVNLIGNAIKFTERGDIVIDVCLEAQTSRDVRLHFTVSDTGIGIPLDKRQTIFDVFSQADDSMARRFGGTGLGLAISRQLVDLMMGGIWVDSEVGKGSTFHFVVQFGLQDGGTVSPSVWRPDALRDLPGLVVDDSPTSRQILTEMLASWGMKAAAVDGGSAALEALRKAADSGVPFRLILLDATLPEMNSRSLIDRIQADPDLRCCRVLLLSPAGQNMDIAQRWRTSVVRCVSKPIKHSDLLNVILEVFSAETGAPRPVTPAAQFEVPVCPLQVLLAEDGLVNRQVAVGLLEMRGHSVVTVTNGKEAIAALATRRFDVVLMDVQMPEMDGLEATAAIRRAEKDTGGHVPIVAMTASAMKGDRERCLAAGMDNYISKPILAEALYAAVESAGPARASDPQKTEFLAATDFIDLNAALRRMRGRTESVRTLARLFLEESAGLLPEIRAAITGADGPRLERAAHTLKGSLDCFAARPAHAVALQLEVRGRDNNFAGAEQSCTDLAQEIERVRTMLLAYLNADPVMVNNDDPRK